MGEVEVVLGRLRPRQRDDPLQVGADHAVFGRRRRQPLEPPELALGRGRGLPPAAAPRRSGAAAPRSRPASRRPPRAPAGSPSAARAGGTRAGCGPSPTAPATGSSSPSSITSSSRARISDSRRSRWVTSRSSSSACLSSVLIRRDPAIMWPSTSGSSTFATATCSSSGQVRQPLDDVREGLLDVALERLQLVRGLEDVGLLVHARDQVGVLRHELVDPHPLAALDQDPQRAVGHPQHARDDAGDAHAVEVVRPGLLVLRIATRDHHEHAVLGQHVVDELHRALLADRQWRHRVRERDDVAQRQHRHDRREVRHRLRRRYRPAEPPVW